MLGGYQNTEDDGSDARQEGLLLSKYAHLVKRAAAHLRSQVTASFSMEDIEQVGLMGLLDAIRRYGQPDEHFESFAFLRVRGSILDELRSQDWRPRNVRQAVHKLNQIRRNMYRELGREPSILELSERTRLSSDKVHELIYADQAESMQCLEDWMTNLKESNNNVKMSRTDKQIMLEKALSKMSDRERLLIALYYQKDLNIKEIALVLEVSEPRVCQIHKECLEKLNILLKEKN
jgi:RNA polymerase sigma factor for flagellar operon FliA